MHSGRGRRRNRNNLGNPILLNKRNVLFLFAVQCTAIAWLLFLYRNAILQFCVDKWHIRVLVNLRAYIKLDNGARAKCSQDFNHQHGPTNTFWPLDKRGWTNGLIDYTYVLYPPPHWLGVVYFSTRVKYIIIIFIAFLGTERAEASEL